MPVPGRFENMDGWVMVREGQPEFYYATTDGKAVIMGFLFDGQGNLITGEQLKAIDISKKQTIAGIVAPNAAPLAQPALPQPETAAKDQAAQPQQQAQQQAAAPAKSGAGEMLFSELETASSMLLGDASKPTFHAFIDPNCSHCRQFLREMEPMVTAGKLAIRIIPVGYDDRSMSQGAYALAISDGAKRFVDLAKGNDQALEPPAGIMTETISNNRKIMTNWRFDATPIIVYRAFGTGEVKIIRGRPLDPAAAVKDLTGQ
ncbi:MAG: hypothetical protein EBQ96_07230 [Proteobacteria bacterium]|nr:hypothetical protein [Pseudomonadota bacterium]